jgi:hypothetical protein
MSAPNSIRIDNVEYVRADAAQATKGPIKICVLDRGWVYVGHTEMDENFLTITNAKNIRAWGTTKGIGELVNGPLPNTRLDFTGTVKVPARAIISLIDVEQGKWSAI